MKLNHSAKCVLDIIPVAAFFAVYKFSGLFAATAVLLALTLMTLLIIYAAERRVALAPLITAIIVTIFGSLTLYLHDEDFIKMKPTFIYLIFALILLGGCLAKKGFLSHVLGVAFSLTPQGWLVLSRRWGIFFLVMAALNEFVRRNFSTTEWVNFKVFGALGLTIVFAVLQTRFIHRNSIPEQDKND